MKRNTKYGALITIMGIAFSCGFFPTASQAQETMTIGKTDSCPGIELVKIPSGCFQMGSSAKEKGRGKDEGPVHEVCLDEFWMARHELTVSQWSWVMENDCDDCSLPEAEGLYPKENISWQETQQFIDKLNKLQKTNNFRLPTEAEWEYAARAGSKTIFSYGNLITPETVNYDGNYPYGKGKKGVYREHATMVGSFQANDFGLYDMHGNVWEYCGDWYAKDYYEQSPAKNPTGPESGKKKIVRGGSWDSDARNCRVAERTKFLPHKKRKAFGFRLVYTK